MYNDENESRYSGDYFKHDHFTEGGEETAQPEAAEAETDRSVTAGIPKIRVIGVGGAGNNAVNSMIEAHIGTAEYIAVNTDAQILYRNLAPKKIQIGIKRTKGLGAGADPEVGREAAEESKDALMRAIEGTDLLFIAAGMGGGTGTGAAPVIAKLAKDKNILTVAIVTEPFAFEGRKKMDCALKGIANLRRYVDTLIVIPNQKILTVVDRDMPAKEAFAIADSVLRQGIRGIADLIVTPGLINCDFADVCTILRGKGLAHMGVGVAKGKDRIREALRFAVHSPLLDTTIQGAHGIIVNIVGGNDLSLAEINDAMDSLYKVVDYNATIIHGVCIDPRIREEIEITVIATGFDDAAQPEVPEKEAKPVKNDQIFPAAGYPREQAPYPASPYAAYPQTPYTAPAPQAPQAPLYGMPRPQQPMQPQQPAAPMYPDPRYVQPAPQAPQQPMQPQQPAAPVYPDPRAQQPPVRDPAAPAPAPDEGYGDEGSDDEPLFVRVMRRKKKQ